MANPENPDRVENSPTWLIDPRNDSVTNECIGKMLPDCTVEDQKCTDGVSRPMYRCPTYDFVAGAKKTLDRIHGRHKVYVRYGPYGLAREWSPEDWKAEKKKRLLEQAKTHAVH